MTTATDTAVERATRVLVLAPLGRNAEVLSRVARQNELPCTVCTDADDLVRNIEHGAGVVVLTGEALSAFGIEWLGTTLARQPCWSDLPLFVICNREEISSIRATFVGLLRPTANVALLEAPTRAFTIATVLRSALRARERQYETRELLERESAARLDAERANRIKDEFLATVSHELSTPLSAILLWSKLACTGALPADQFPRTLELIHRSAVAQNVLIDDLLDGAQMMSGQLTIARQASQLAPAVNGAIEIVRPSAETKGVHLDAVIDDNAGIVMIDSGRMRQVAWNLLTNAVKFTPAGGKVAITLRRDLGIVRLEVVDSGQGITADFMPHIFEPFRQAEGGSTRRNGGVGLGLAITKKLVDLHGGTIKAESAGAGRGSTFTVELPLANSGTNSSTGPVA